MPDISVTVFRKELLDLLEETFEKTQGIYLDRETSLFQTLDELTADQASKSISPKGATIAGHTEHMAFYLDVLTDCIERKPIGKLNWQESWKVQSVDEAAWVAVRQRLHKAHQRTIRVIQSLDAWEGEDDIGASLAILAHTASHLGAIRQALHLL